MENKKTNYLKIIKEICKEENIKLDTFSYDYIFRLDKDNKIKYIYGCKFGLDIASNQNICDDKSATSELLDFNNIDNVEHEFFMIQDDVKYIDQGSIFEDCKDMLNKYKRIVIKDNNNSGGKNVYYVDNLIDLENVLLKKLIRFSVAPFYDIIDEYRVIVLNGEIKLIYKKDRPCLIGDGNKTIKQLYLEYLLENNFNNVLDIQKKDLNKILKKDEIYLLNWKHNLSLGAKSNKDIDDNIKIKLSNIAKDVVNKLNLNFVSIDIINTGGEYKVLEINSGVSMGKFSKENNDNYNIAKDIYKQAILSMFGGK